MSEQYQQRRSDNRPRRRASSRRTQRDYADGRGEAARERREPTPRQRTTSSSRRDASAKRDDTDSSRRRATDSRRRDAGSGRAATDSRRQGGRSTRREAEPRQRSASTRRAQTRDLPRDERRARRGEARRPARGADYEGAPDRHMAAGRSRHMATGRSSRSTLPGSRPQRSQAQVHRPIPANTRSYSLRDRRRTGTPQMVLVAILAVLVLGVGGFFLVRNLTVKRIVVGGETITVARNATPRTLVERGLVETPKAGNLLAVDGSLLSKGDGELCSATADGAPVGVDEEIPPNTTVEIGPGGDLTEDYSERKEAIPYGKSNDDTGFSAYFDAAIHILSRGEDGLASVKTGNVSGITVEDVIRPAVDEGYVIYNAKPDDKVIALTFDDGPLAGSTDKVLDILEEYGAKATFFTIGNQISGNEDLIQREAELGCQVCTHTWDHAAGDGGGVDLTKMSASDQIEEVEKGYEAIADALGEEPSHILRAPGGNFHDDIIDTLWDYVDAEIGWNVDTEDWNKPGTDAIVEQILSAKSGNVILMHDGGGDRSQTIEALEEALPKLIDEGYTFVTIDELLAYGLPK